MPEQIRPRDRARAFCEQYRIERPILLAPMAGACPASLSIAIGTAGGMGAMGALISSPDAIRQWAAEVRAAGVHAFQLNTWIPDPAPKRDTAAEEQVRSFLAEKELQRERLKRCKLRGSRSLIRPRLSPIR